MAEEPHYETTEGERRNRAGRSKALWIGGGVLVLLALVVALMIFGGWHTPPVHH